MKLYHRLIIAMVLAATAGATALVLLLAFPWAPLVAWGAMAGILTAGAMVVARWAMAPLRQLAESVGAGDHLASRDLLDRVADTITELRNATSPQADSDPADAQPWHAIQQGPTLLFNTVTTDSLTQPHHQFAVPVLSEWVREGQTTVAALLWDGNHPTTFIGNGDLTEHDLPTALTALPRIASQPILHTENGTLWAGFPIPSAPPKEGGLPTPRLLITAWPEQAAPSEPLLAGFAAVAHYFGLRAKALNGIEQLPETDKEYTLKADYLAHVQQQLAQSITTMSDYSRRLMDAGGHPTDELLEQADRLLAQIAGLVDLTTVRWNPPRTPAERLNITTLIEQITSRHPSAETITLDLGETAATARILTEPTPLSAAVGSLLDLAGGNRNGNHRVTVAASQVGPATAPLGEFTIRTNGDTPSHPPLPSPRTDIDAAFVSHLARQRGGRLTIDREPDGGTRFTLNWPYVPTTGPGPARAA